MDLTADGDITLRPLDRENAAALWPLFRRDLAELRRWFPFDESYSLENDRDYVEGKTPPYDETYVIFFRGSPCGRVGLYDWDEAGGEISLYYWVASGYRRKRIGTRSVRAVLAHLKALGLRRALFDVKKENTESLALIRALEGACVRSEDADGYVFSCEVAGY